MAKNYASNRDIIVSVFMRGGADGLSLCVPFADPNYYTSRSTIAIPRPDSRRPTRASTSTASSCSRRRWPGLRAGVSPAHGPARRARDGAAEQRRARTSTRSDTWKSASRSIRRSSRDGSAAIWRAFRRSSPTRRCAASASRTDCRKTLVGGPQTLPIADPTNYSIGGSAATQAQRLAFMQGDYAGADEPVHSAALDATNTVDLLKTVNFAGYTPANGAVYPNSSFGRALRSVAVLIKADVGIEAAQVDIGGWDTHSGQDPIAGSMFKTMQDFSNSLGAFYADVIATGYNVTVVAFSEFGRNVRENGSQGTDHGRGTTMFAMGKGIAGGRVLTKNWPGLASENLEYGAGSQGDGRLPRHSLGDRAESTGESEPRLRLPDVDADDARRHAVESIVVARNSFDGRDVGRHIHRIVPSDENDPRPHGGL